MNNKYFRTLCAALILTGLLFSSPAYSASKKKLFINNITPEAGISNEFAVKIRDEITLSIFENFSSRYQIVTDEDISVMYEKTSLIMTAGGDSESAVVQIANAVNADEIIYGNISKSGIKYRLTVHNLLRDARNNSVGKKSFVAIEFPETQTNWYCREIAKKLIEPSYRIDERKAVTMIVPTFHIDDIDIKTISVSAIQQISFDHSDEIVGRIINDLKPLVEEGDVHFNKGNYSRALSSYRKVITTIGTKLRRDTQVKIQPFIEEIIDRIGVVHTRGIQNDIEKIDKYLQAQQPPTIAMLKTGLKAYEDILRKLAKLPSHEREGMKKALGAIENRLTAIYISWVSLYEKAGDTEYSQYQFRKAIAYYNEGIVMIDNCRVKNETMSAARANLERKKNTVLATGTSWLENRVVSYCNAAEYLNMKGARSRAKKYLNDAKNVITKNKDFANQRMVDVYNDTARIVR